MVAGKMHYQDDFTHGVDKAEQGCLFSLFLLYAIIAGTVRNKKTDSSGNNCVKLESERYTPPNPTSLFLYWKFEALYEPLTLHSSYAFS